MNTKEELQIFLKNHKDYLEHLAYTEARAFDGRAHYNPDTGNIFVIIRKMAIYIIKVFDENMCEMPQGEVGG